MTTPNEVPQQLRKQYTHLDIVATQIATRQAFTDASLLIRQRVNPNQGGTAAVCYTLEAHYPYTYSDSHLWLAWREDIEDTSVPAAYLVPGSTRAFDTPGDAVNWAWNTATLIEADEFEASLEDIDSEHFPF